MKLEDALKTTRFTNEKHKATLNVLYSAYWLRNSFSVALREDNLTLEQFNVMRILRGQHPGEMCVRDIGNRMIEKSSNVPRIIDRLVEKKLARRVSSKVDKRETLISLTDNGLTLLERASGCIEGVNDGITTLTDIEWMLLNNLLEKMRTAVPEAAAPELP